MTLFASQQQYSFINENFCNSQQQQNQQQLYNKSSIHVSNIRIETCNTTPTTTKKRKLLQEDGEIDSLELNSSLLSTGWSRVNQTQLLGQLVTSPIDSQDVKLLQQPNNTDNTQLVQQLCGQQQNNGRSQIGTTYTGFTLQTLGNEPQRKRRRITKCINSLPDHILYIIFSYLAKSVLVKDVVRVCKRWYDAARHPFLWKEIDFQGFNVKTMGEALEFLQSLFGSRCASVAPKFEKFNGIIKLPKNCLKMNAMNFRMLRKVCPNLSGLSLPAAVTEIPSISDASLKQISQFENLKVLNLGSHSKISDDGVQYLTKLQKLEKITLDGCPRLTLTALRSIVQSCKNLKSISMLGCGHALESDDVKLLAQNGRYLTELRVDFGNVDFTSFEMFIKNCNKLRKLQIRGYPTIDGKCFDLICSELNYLEELSIICGDNVDIYSPKIKSKSLNSLQLSRAAGIYNADINCPNLKKLWFEQCGTMKNLWLHGDKIQELKFRSCTMSGVDLSRILNSMKSLKDLEIFDCKSADLNKLEIKLDNLEKMILFMCNDVIQLELECAKLNTLSVDVCMEMKTMILKCPQLETAQLFVLPQLQYPKLTKIEIESDKLVSLNLQRAIALEQASFICAALDALNMAGCKELKKLEPLKCPKLDKLAIGGTHLQYTKESIIQFTTDCPSISMLSISNASHLDDECLTLMCDRLKRLQALVISNCASLKSPNIDAPNLKGLFLKSFPSDSSLGIQMTDCLNLDKVNIYSKNLTKLFLRNCNSIKDETINKISTTCPNIKYLEIFNCGGLRKPVIKCSELTDLHFSKCNNLEAPGLDCPKLKKLLFLSCQKMQRIAFQNPSVAASEILFSECPSVSDGLVESLHNFIPNVQAVVFSKCDGIKMPKIYFDQLKVLRFSECNGLMQPRIFTRTLTNKVNILSFQDCKNLSFQRTSDFLKVKAESVEFSNCENLQNLLFDMQARKVSFSQCKNLRELLMWNDSLIKAKIQSCDSLTIFGAYSSNLKELIIRDCNDLTNLVLQNCNELTSVEFAKCQRVSDICVAALLNKSPQLRNIQITKCGLSSPVLTHKKLSHMSISGCAHLERIIIECDNMRELHLSECYQLMTKSILLNHNAEKLHTLTISNMHVTAEGILDVLSKAPNVSHIQLKNTGLSGAERKKIMSVGIKAK